MEDVSSITIITHTTRKSPERLVSVSGKASYRVYSRIIHQTSFLPAVFAGKMVISFSSWSGVSFCAHRPLSPTGFGDGLVSEGRKQKAIATIE